MIKVLNKSPQLLILLSITLALLSISIIFFASYPGFYSPDSHNQLLQALAGEYEDWHSPLMSWTWSILIRMTNLIESMFIFHTIILFTAAVYWVLISNKLVGFRCSLFIPLLLISPVITVFFGTVWKDVGFAYFMLLSCGILILGILNNKISILLLVTVSFLLFFSFGFRANGIFAIIPIIFLSSWCFFKNTKGKMLKSITTTGIIILVIVLSTDVFYYSILNAKKSSPFRATQLNDLTGISATSGKNYFPEISNKIPGFFKKIQKGYKGMAVYANIDHMIFLKQAPFSQKELSVSWINSIRKNPALYLKHRWMIFCSIMNKAWHSSSRRPLNILINDGKGPYVYDINFKGLTIFHRFLSINDDLGQIGFLQSGWFWPILLLSEIIAGVFIIRDKKIKVIILLLSSSGMLYLLPYFIIAPSCDFRYLYWSTIAAALCFLFTISRLKSKHFIVFSCMAFYLSSVAIYSSLEDLTKRKWRHDALENQSDALVSYYDLISSSIFREDASSLKSILAKIKGYGYMSSNDGNISLFLIIQSYIEDKNQKNLERIANTLIRGRNIHFPVRVRINGYIQKEMSRYASKERLSYLSAVLLCPQVTSLPLLRIGHSDTLATDFIRGCLLNARDFLESSARFDEEKEKLKKIIKKLEESALIPSFLIEKYLSKEVREEVDRKQDE